MSHPFIHIHILLNIRARELHTYLFYICMRALAWEMEDICTYSSKTGETLDYLCLISRDATMV